MDDGKAFAESFPIIHSQIKAWLSKDYTRDFDLFLAILGSLLEIDNSPLARSKSYKLRAKNSRAKLPNKQKAQKIFEILKAHNVQSEILELDSKEGVNQKWYVVEAIVGEVQNANKLHGLVSTHHDNVVNLEGGLGHKKGELEEENIEKLKEWRFYHPWILDDHLQLAGQISGLINLSKNWKELNKKGCIRFVFTDGEEVNTQGMAAYLEYLDKKNQIVPFDFVLLGEACGSETTDIGFSYSFRGKSVLSVELDSAETSNTWDVATNFLNRARILQFSLYNYSGERHRRDSKGNILPNLNRTAFIPTVLDIKTKENGAINANIFAENRCNNKIKASNVGKYAREIFEMNRNRLYKIINTDYSFKKLFRAEQQRPLEYKVEVQNEGYKYLYIRIKNNFEDAKTHPGAFDPTEANNIYRILQHILHNVPENYQKALKRVWMGDMTEKNKIPNEVYLVFSKEEIANFDSETLVHELYKPTKNSEKNNIFAEFSEKQKRTIWNVRLRTDIAPVRDGLGRWRDNQETIEIARKNLKKVVKQATNGKVSVSAGIGVFNAMTDGGPLTYSQYKARLFPHAQNVVVMGAGNFSQLHKQEYVTAKSLLAGFLQYFDLIETILKKL